MNYDTLLILVHLCRAWKTYYIRLGRLNRVLTTTIIYIADTLTVRWDRTNTYTAVQQANKPIDVNNNIDKLKLFIKMKTKKSLLKWWIMIPLISSELIRGLKGLLYTFDALKQSINNNHNIHCGYFDSAPRSRKHSYSCSTS